MSINRTRWLDKLRPAGASSGGWTEGPMAPVMKMMRAGAHTVVVCQERIVLPLIAFF